ncbi:hypothetical protein BBK36DRAFT_1137705 [Trichoderma citrinoviride]|uniref:Uncharacterized protein n=1 Tax=Trichoderma citrinoviride TaxID=58853 RepID=A0A2T4BIZ4_9HYPO|nr:hypothetical protein BBK36DRAFT_1137705 [Trichoderma citrinoviride]PTB69258.1 hypothetical protein BBK36DRAFT_1137705 [Trichoderma citrinoviride]
MAIGSDPLKGLPDDYVIKSQAFTKELYQDVYPAIDPSNAALSQDGKIVIVTGASKGIGRKGFVRSFATAEARAIVLVARSFKQLQEAAEELSKEFPKTQFLPIACDVKDETSVKAVFDKILEVFGTADVLVNNAGTTNEGKPLRSASMANVWNGISIKEVNLKGPLLMVHEFLNLVGTTKPATVINVTSAVGFVVIPGKASYSLSKLALTHLSGYIAAENPNVRAISLHPGTILTDITSEWLVRFSKDTPELAGGMAVWLTTKEAAFLNGSLDHFWDFFEAQSAIFDPRHQYEEPLHRRDSGLSVSAASAEAVNPFQGTIEETINPDALIPITLLTTREINSDLDGILDLFATVDDVFQPDFGSVLVEKPEKEQHAIGLNRHLDSLGRSVLTLRSTGAEDEARAAAFEDLPSGPYFLHGPNLYQAWRLYDDVLDAFTFGVIPNSINGSDDGFEALSALSDNGSHKSIAVPSRLYHPAPSIRKPLSGVRISITDAISLKGVQTTMSSRAWTQLYGAEESETAEFAQRLIDMGAIIVGKTKSSQLDSGREWVDAEAPWNPRGDGYQESGGSAAGAGASQQMLLRELVSKGVGMVFTPSEPRPALHLSQDGQLIRRIMLRMAQVTINTSSDDVPFPKRIIYLLDYAPPSEDDQSLDHKFVAVLEKFLGIKADRVRLSETWDANPPNNTKQSLEEYMKEAPFSSFCYDFYHQYGDFRNHYKDKFGRQPYIEATPRFRWGIGESETKQDHDHDRLRIEGFRRWFNESIMPIVGDSETIVIVPFGPQTTVHYRDDLPPPPSVIEGLKPEALAPLLGLPHLVVPFAQTRYYSRVTDRGEDRPFSGSIIGPRGSDMMLLQLVKAAFARAEWRSSVAAGRLAFPQGYEPE